MLEQWWEDSLVSRCGVNTSRLNVSNKELGSASKWCFILSQKQTTEKQKTVETGEY